MKKKELEEKIMELEKRIEFLERVRTIPYIPFNPLPQPMNNGCWCSWCQRYNCGQHRLNYELSKLQNDRVQEAAKRENAENQRRSEEQNRVYNISKSQERI